MAHAKSISAHDLQELSLELPEWLEASELPAAGVEIALPPLPIWDVEVGPSLEAVAQNSGEWHLQLKNNEGVFAYARVRVIDGHVEVVAVGESPLPEVIERTLGGLDAPGDTGPELRLLRSPRLYTTCLWLHYDEGIDQIIVLLSQHLQTGARFDEQAFLARLASLPPPGMTAAAAPEPRYRAVPVWGKERNRPVRQVEL